MTDYLQLAKDGLGKVADDRLYDVTAALIAIADGIAKQNEYLSMLYDMLHRALTDLNPDEPIPYRVVDFGEPIDDHPADCQAGRPEEW